MLVNPETFNPTTAIQAQFDKCTMVFYLPRTIRNPSEFLASRMGSGVVVLKREKMMCVKLTVEVWRPVKIRPVLAISASSSFEKFPDNSCSNHVKLMNLSRTIMRLEKKNSTLKSLVTKLRTTAQTRQIANTEGETPEADDKPCCLNLTATTLDELNTIQTFHRHRRRYGEMVLDISQMLYSLSPKAYRLLRQILPFPSPKTLWRHYGHQLKDISAALAGSDFTLNVTKAIDSYDLTQSNTFTLAIDAFAFRSFTNVTMDSSKNRDKIDTQANQESVHEGSTTVKTLSNGFMFLLIPLCSQQEPRLLHIAAKTNGSYDKSIHEIYIDLKSQLEQGGVKLWFKATDGDPYLHSEHELFFDKHVSNHEGDFTVVTDEVYNVVQEEGKSMPIADPLHFAKNARARVINHPVALVWDEKMAFVTAESLEKTLHLGKALEDKSTIGKMRDCYVIKLFTLSNVVKLIRSHDYAGAFFLLPYASLFAAIYECNLTNETRVFFVRLAYYCFLRFLHQIPVIVGNSENIKTKFQQGSIATTITEPAYVIRMLHTCIALAISLRHGPRFVRMDALGTHLVENRIGIARASSHDPRWARILSHCSASELRKRLATKHKLQLYVPHRINHGGAKVDTCLSLGLQLPNWDASDIVEMFANSLNSDIEEAIATEMMDFADELSPVADRIVIPLHENPNKAANNGIMARNINFQGFKDAHKSPNLHESESDSE